MATGRVPTTANSPLTAKGDLFTYSTAPARLAVGTNGDSLVANSSTSTGLAWAGNYAAGKNKIINGDFGIWQRGTSGTIAAGSYVAADRFYTYRNTTGSTFSRQTSGLTGFQYSGRIARDSGNTATANISVGQSIETANSLPLAGQTVTLSFWAKAGANFSATSNILRARVLSSTTQDQNIILNGGTSVIDQNVTLTTSWQRFSYSGAVGSTALTVGTIFSYDPTGTAGAADNFEITGMQVEAGSVATAFQTATGTIQGELAACQRYFNRIANCSQSTNQMVANGRTDGNSAESQYTIRNNVTMRSNPTLTVSAAGDFFVDGSSRVTATSITGDQLTPISINLVVAHGAISTYQATRVFGKNSTGTIDLSAEL